MRQANRAGFDVLVFAGFAFEAAATAAIEDPGEREVKVLWTQNPPGFADDGRGGEQPPQDHREQPALHRLRRTGREWYAWRMTGL